MFMKRKRTSAFILGAFLVSHLWALGHIDAALAADPKEPAAVVNDEAIPMGDVIGMYRAHYEIPPEEEIKENDPTVIERMTEVLDGLIERKLLDQEARKRGTVASPEDVEAQLKKFVERFPSRSDFEKMLVQLGLTEEDLKSSLAENVKRQQLIREQIYSHITVSEEEMAAEYQEHTDVYVIPERIRARHILIVVPPDSTPDQDLFARKRAEQVLDRAVGGEDFGSLAEKYSMDESTRAQGGNLGYFFKGSLPEGLKAVDEAAFALQPGEISGLVRTGYGYHIVKVEERLPAEQGTYEDAKPAVKANVFGRKASERYREFISSLRENGKVEIYFPAKEAAEEKKEQ